MGRHETEGGARWPLLAAAGLLLAGVAVLAGLSMRQNDGHLIYALDDAYIHMALAKNFSQHGVWGVTRHEFSSCSSSLLWTLLLSGVFRLTGPTELAPFLLALGGALLLLAVADHLLRAFALPPWPRLAGLGFCAFAIPLPALIFTGMEHLLHGVLTLVFAYLVAREVAPTANASGRRVAWLVPLLATLLVMSRLEGMYLVALGSLVLLLRRRVGLAVAVAAAGALPIVVYAVISTHLGALWAPNSVLLKSTAAHSFSLRHFAHLLVYTSWDNLQEAPHLFIVMVLALLLLYRHLRAGRKVAEPAATMAVLFVLAAYMHLTSAGIGWFYRYEAYLMALGLITVAGLAWQALERGGGWRAQPRDLPTNAALAAFVLVAALPLLYRGQAALRLIPISTTNIYQQQYQMGRFVRDCYPGSTILANDIGAVTYLGEVRCLDSAGLASVDVARAKLAGKYDLRFMTDWARTRGAEVAIVYDQWFERDFGGFPDQWRCAGRWQIPNNRICGGDTVSFYAVRPGAYPGLVSRLRQFASQLPAAVIQTGDFTRPQPPAAPGPGR